MVKVKEHGLIDITYGQSQYRLGLWSTGLGAWKIDRQGVLEPHVPMFSLFWDYGHPAIDRDQPGYENWQLFLSEVPQQFKSKAFVELHQCQYLALEACYHAPEFRDFVEQEYAAKNLSFIAAVWMLNEQFRRPLPQRLELNQKMLKAKRADLLRELLDEPVQPLLLRLIQRTQCHDISREHIRLLHKATKRPALARVLGDVKYISAHGFRLLYDELPEWLFHPQICQTVTLVSNRYHSLQAIFPPSILNADEVFRDRIFQALKTVKIEHELEARLRNLADNIALEQIFPKPPFKGNKRLYPVVNGAMLKAEGKFMKNCVPGYADSIRAGKHYFYHYRGDSEEASVLLALDGGQSWFVSEHLGVGNSELKDESMIDIYDHLLRLAGQEVKLHLPIFRAEGIEYLIPPDLYSPTTIWYDCEFRPEPSRDYGPDNVSVFLSGGERIARVPPPINRRMSLLLQHGFRLEGRLFLAGTGKYYELNGKLYVRILPRKKLTL